MISKILWILCLCLLVVFLTVFLWQTNFSKKIVNISGLKTTLPNLDQGELSKPPRKIANAVNPNINAKALLLSDIQSGQKLYAKNADQKVPIASTTKIMTSLVVLENYSQKMKDVVTITREMTAVEGSDIQLRMSEKITVENLLKGLLISSGNDAALAIANFFGGKDEFVAKMNEKARFIGLKNTLYKDPAGLDDNGYSTAEDLSVLSSYALRDKTFAEIVKMPETTITSSDGQIIHELKTSNRLLKPEEPFYLPFAQGIKTGFTNDAGHCLVSVAQKDDHELLSVILNTDQNTLTASAQESKKLLEWGFANWQW